MFDKPGYVRVEHFHHLEEKSVGPLDGREIKEPIGCKSGRCLCYEQKPNGVGAIELACDSEVACVGQLVVFLEDLRLQRTMRRLRFVHQIVHTASGSILSRETAPFRHLSQTTRPRTAIHGTDDADRMSVLPRILLCRGTQTRY